MPNNEIKGYCYECKHRFENGRSKTGHSCELWGHDDFADDVDLNGYCYKFKSKYSLKPIQGLCFFENKEDAENILNKMIEIAERYDVVTILDFKELRDLESEYIDIRYGWLKKPLRKTKILHTQTGWFIDFPTAFPID